ncbi:MAG: response regulator [Tessaracoccus sp.]|uniref:response regulator n=1 Tax=Tessaracoccus sp. TaxID=1971211 RepID=UPI001EB1F63B|nr:response regulator [Tessaracoccus sp.]MBK7820320.1 response regulator [Tessaracoccus sp.]
MIRAGVCEDDPRALAALCSIIERNEPSDRTRLKVTAAVSSGEQAAERYHAAHIWLMDVQLPGISGVEACARILRKPDPPYVLMITALPDPRITEALEAGAVGFLFKDEPADVLKTALRAGSRGLTVLSTTAVRYLGSTPPIEQALPGEYEEIVQDDKDTKLAALVLEGRTVDDMARTLGFSLSGTKKRLARMRERAGVTSTPMLISKLHSARAADERDPSYSSS